MTQHLVITAMGTDRPGICNKIVQLITQSGLNIVDSRIALLGEEFSLLMMVSGSSSELSRIETHLPAFGMEHGLITMMKRTKLKSGLNHTYIVEVFVESDDRPGLAEKITTFFAHRQIGIEALSAQTDRPSTTHANGENFHMTLSAKVNADYNLVQLQTEFAQLCSTLNVSGTLNFIKNSA
ncbi:glycine cleavage system protein R [Vibrio palustris]|uniref:Glycine cleavage system transcriptional repressor n=1 Tax=Vibrio palustris TaxID=1918946 RepID=A0A1R4B078_9VIBR|nr:ACT domain-containing protein [Vibrio palustris]SJL82318.1 Glycine cleavage system transcriptional repressor [Vibrio palustris]